MHRLTLQILCVLLFAAGARAQELTKKTWRNDPRIAQVRALYESTNKLLSAKRLTVARKNELDCISWNSERTQYSDERGVVRRYVVGGGGEDSAVMFDHTYDAQGKLRFALVRAGAVNETTLELRFYFDAAGKLLWRDRKLIGPGYTWTEEDFERELAREPKVAFERKPECN